MSKQWQEYSEKFIQLTTREQFLLLLTGLVAIFFIISYLFIDEEAAKADSLEKRSKGLQSEIRSLNYSITQFEASLKQDPDIDIAKQIQNNEIELEKLDNQLVLLTTDLISPIEMREALLKLLKLEPGVSLLSFELSGAKPLLNLVAEENAADSSHNLLSAEELGLKLYKHGIKLKLSGEYFQLRNYLAQLEQLQWKFFWQDFVFDVKEYPQSEVDITIYSLGLNKEFIGV